ncbi:hypothetical protein E3N88_32830 [Mikania micrantha]|uniref:Uncharacterized protein n=1 Tax=Mikania micrantha TaxID=192012 RepID=A0A5N6M9N9_9ASTR|nr:hypothetical protein E3N88_32830 [Mikania micrantha]
MALLPFKPAHNLPAELSAEHDADFAPIISFLQRSRYNFALTVKPLVYESHHQQFWASCSVSSSPNGRILNATIDAHPISITVETICRHLQLCDAGGRVSLTKDEVFVQLKKKSAKFSGNFTPLLPSMELPTPEGDNSVAPIDVEPTPSTFVSHPITITYKRRRTPEQLSTVVQVPSSEPIKKKVKRTAKGTVPPKVKTTLVLIPQAQGSSAIAVEEPLSPTTQTLMRVVTQLQARFPDLEPTTSEVDPGSQEGVNADEAATTVDPNQDPQDSGTGTRTSPTATHIGEDFFEALLNEGNPGCQETTTGGGGAGARLRTPSPSDSIHVDEGTKEQELTAIVTTLQARVANLEAEVATLRLEVQTKDATILDLKRRPPVILQPFHPDPATTTFISLDATKKGENAPSAGSGPEVREEEGAQEVNPSIVTLTTEWDDFLGTYFHDSSTTSSSSSYEATMEVAKETEQDTTNVSLEPQSPAGTQSPAETTTQVAMEETTQEEPISMEPVSPSGTMAVEDLSSTPEHSVDTAKESPKMVGQPEEAVNAKVNSEAAAASEGPVIIDDSSTEKLMANEPVSEATGSTSSGVKLTADDKGKRKLTPEEEAEQEERRPNK